MSGDQRKTPYLDAMLRYRDAGFTPFHTPGHKLGKGAPSGMVEAFGMQLLQVDVAMAGGIEDTRESTHLLQAAEQLAAEAYGADDVSLPGQRIDQRRPVAGHDPGRAGRHGDHPAQLPQEPADRPDLLGRHAALRRAAHRPVVGHPAQRAHRGRRGGAAFGPRRPRLFVTSPTYNGFGADLRRIAELVHAAGMPFVVDQAWGPHFRFCSLLPDDAMSAGADAAVASTHKLISGLTQSSVLLARAGRINLARLASVVKMTQSTSPQTLMYVSIDAARAQMATEGEELWSRAVDLAQWARARIDQIDGLRCIGDECLREPGVAAFDPTRLTVTAGDLGHSGWQLESILRDDYRIAVEAADPLNIVLNVTYGDSREDVERLVGALADYAARFRERAADAAVCDREHLLIKLPPFTRQVLSPHDAFFAHSVPLPLRECLGRVSAEIVTPYPPGIPVLGPGEEIGPLTVNYLEEASARQLHVHGPEDATLRTLRVVE